MNPEAFLRTIREHPDDDGPRLVYADWLEERGECDRAEFIRVQCELEQSPDDEGFEILARREKELLERHYGEWFSDWLPGPGAQIRRGFLDVEITTADAVQVSVEQLSAPGLLQLAIANFEIHAKQVEQLRSWQGHSSITCLEPAPRHWNEEQSTLLRRCLDSSWSRLQALTLPAFAFSGDDLSRLESLPSLRRLRLHSVHPWLGGHDWRSVVRSPVIEKLHALELDSIQFSEHDAREFGHDFGRARQPVHLALSNCRLGTDELEEFLHSCDLRRLRSLNLTGNPLRDSGVMMLADTEFDALTELTLGDCQCGGQGIRALMDSGLLGRLSSLHLNNNFLDDSKARSLLESGALNSLQQLTLGSDLTDHSLIFFANSSHVGRWRGLTVHGSITSKGMLSLLRSTETTDLMHLRVIGLQLQLGQIPNLNRKAFSSRLRELRFGDGPVSRQSVVNLLSSPGLPRLRRLRIPSVSPISSVPELQQRFGSRFVCDEQPLAPAYLAVR